jgi:hypothetical protein
MVGLMRRLCGAGDRQCVQLRRQRFAPDHWLIAGKISAATGLMCCTMYDEPMLIVYNEPRKVHRAIAEAYLELR